MPAYRSSAEAEIRDAVVARLRQFRPNARIMHEVNASSFGNRIDVLAVDRAEIIAVEVKSEKDKLDRLPEQIKAMGGCAHHVIAALHDKFWIAADKIKDRNVRSDWTHLPTEVDRAIFKQNVAVWRYPEKGGPHYGFLFDRGWREPPPQPTICLPPAAISMLWADELRHLCERLGVQAGSRANMPFCINALRWGCTGEQITKGICAALRARRCIEADPAIEVAA